MVGGYKLETHKSYLPESPIRCLGRLYIWELHNYNYYVPECNQGMSYILFGVIGNYFSFNH